jgi:hypothetical protein
MSADTVDFVAYCFEEHMVKANWTLPTALLLCYMLVSDVSVVYCKRKWNILWNVRVFRGINKALKQQPRPIRLSQ